MISVEGESFDQETELGCFVLFTWKGELISNSSCDYLVALGAERGRYNAVEGENSELMEVVLIEEGSCIGGCGIDDDFGEYGISAGSDILFNTGYDFSNL